MIFFYRSCFPYDGKKVHVISSKSNGKDFEYNLITNRNFTNSYDIKILNRLPDKYLTNSSWH